MLRHVRQDEVEQVQSERGGLAESRPAARPTAARRRARAPLACMRAISMSRSPLPWQRSSARTARASSGACRLGRLRFGSKADRRAARASRQPKGTRPARRRAVPPTACVPTACEGCARAARRPRGRRGSRHEPRLILGARQPPLLGQFDGAHRGGTADAEARVL